MGTRGFVGFVVDGHLKNTYNHWDSYPEGLGVSTLNWLKEHLLDDPRSNRGQILHPEVASMVARLQMVNESDEPTPEQRAAVAGFADPNVSTGKDWYSALRQCQGDLTATLRAGYMTDCEDFPLDSLFCEWGYLIDADARVFEVYKGFNEHETPSEGRWAGIRNPEQETITRADGSTYVRENYQPVQRIVAIPFDEIPELLPEEFCGRCEPSEVEA